VFANCAHMALVKNVSSLADAHSSSYQTQVVVLWTYQTEHDNSDSLRQLPADVILK